MLALHELHIDERHIAQRRAAMTLLDCYKAVEDGSRRMLAAAQAGDWQGVAQLEGDCAAMIQHLKRCANQGGRDPELPPLQRQEKQRILQRILSVDAQIRCLCEPAGQPSGSLARPATALLH
jgi:flagellar protein FliT